MVHLFYQLCVGLSGVMLLLFVMEWRKNAAFEYMFTFAMVPVVNLGYVWLAASENLREAIVAQKIIYLGGCFLNLFLFFGILSICNIKLKSWVKTLLIFAAFLMYGCVLTMNKWTLYYKSVSFSKIGDVTILVKDYGPLHTMFYIYMILILLASIVVVIYAWIYRPGASIRNLVILIIMDALSLVAFFGEKILAMVAGMSFEVMPLFYVIAEIIFLILFHRIRLYDVSSGIAENLLEDGEDGIICFDRQKRFLTCNRTAKKILPSLEKAKADMQLADEKQLSMIIHCLNLFSNNEINREPYVLEKDDKIYEIIPNHMMDGRIKCGYYLMLYDVTKDRKYAREMKAAAEAAIAAEKAKGSFLAQMSHEIRTPINAVLGMNEMIMREAKDDDILDYAESIQSAGKTLLLLINSILDFSKIESGKMEIVPVKYSTASMIENCLNSIMPRAASKSLLLKKEVDPRLPRELFGDDVRVGQVIVNLLTNAVKYTEQGSVTLRIFERSRDEKNVTIRVEVCDTGIGIKKEDMDKLFESFGRIDEKRNRNIEGTGLGMSIVTGLLKMMNSRLEVSSEYGKGSTFSFEIGQEISDPSPIGEFNIGTNEKKNVVRHDMVLLPGKEILVVDDNSMNLKVASRFLKLSRIDADLAGSGAEAIEMVKKKQYDMILLDHMMPKMDGMETLEIMKKEGLISEKTVVVALTANAIMGAKETYIKAGFDDYMSKPIDIKTLDEMLKKYLV